MFLKKKKVILLEILKSQLNFQKKIIKQFKKCLLNKIPLKSEKLKNANLLIFASPTEQLNEREQNVLSEFIEKGGNVLFLSSEGKHLQKQKMCKFFKKFGLKLKNNSILRCNYYKYFHPKEVLINNGVLHEDFIRSANGEEKTLKKSVINLAGINLMNDNDFEEEENYVGFQFLYPFGSSLQVEKPSIPILSSGSVSYPANECLMSMYESRKKGKLFVLGSWQLFNDEYFDKEENQKIIKFILNNLNIQDFEAEQKEETFKKFSQNLTVPNIEAMAEKNKNALQQSEDISNNFFNMFDKNLYKVNFDLLPDSIRLYDKLQVKHESLKLISPIFETPMLGLTPSVFPPVLIELEPPKLELFNLDDEFANQEIKMAELTNKSTDKDLEYYISESANIMGLKDKVNTNNPKEVLLYILNQIMKFKSSHVQLN